MDKLEEGNEHVNVNVCADYEINSTLFLLTAHAQSCVYLLFFLIVCSSLYKGSCIVTQYTYVSNQ